MELIQGTHKASNFAQQDIISIMPDNVVTNILDLLPVQHAVRTSILSRSWRFKWTMLSQLVFDGDFYEYLKQTKRKNNRGGIISRLLFQIEGAIEKFVLMHRVKDDNDVENINHWILFLSTKGIKDLTLRNRIGAPLKLPTHLFSCLELKHLKLDNCCFHLPHSFHGFPNLLSLELGYVQIESNELGEILTRCPLLETLRLIYLNSTGSLLVEIAKAKNLKILFLSKLGVQYNYLATISSSTIFELVGSLPKLQELNLDLQDWKLTEGDAIKRSPTTSLKALKLLSIDFGNVVMLSCVYEMIRHFTNLKTLVISAIQRNVDPIPNPEAEYNPIGLESVVFRSFIGSENEVCLIKYLLGYSPFLEKIVIHPHWCLLSDGRLMFAKKLLKLSRASTTAQIDFV